VNLQLASINNPVKGIAVVAACAPRPPPPSTKVLPTLMKHPPQGADVHIHDLRGDVGGLFEDLV
jgi:hypothetical protein